MGKAVLISIKPKWCELIASGKKTIEIRKSRPKLETPFKCYIYMAAGNASYPVKIDGKTYVCHNNGGKAVIGEFVCDRIEEYPQSMLAAASGLDKVKLQTLLTTSCLLYNNLAIYVKNKENRKPFYGWHISDLVFYEKPIPLTRFVVEGDCAGTSCRKCFWFVRGNGYNIENDCNLADNYIYRRHGLKPLFRPPQSWCYLDDAEDTPFQYKRRNEHWY